MYRVIAAKLNVDVSRCQRLWRSSKSYALQFSSTASRFEHHHDHNADNQRANGVQESDVAIVGGGMVGMALACSLASSPLTRNVSIAIIDDNPALNAGGLSLISKDALPDPRVSTITPASISFLQDIVAWKYIEQQRHAYFDKMQVWDYTGLGYTRYNAKDVNKEVCC